MTYLVFALTGILAAYRASGVLRIWLAYDVGMSVLLKLYTVLAVDHKAANHAYRLAWMIAEPVGGMLAAAVVITRCRPRMWPVLPALALHVWAGGFANVWPGSWLQAEEHAVGFCCMALGLVLAASPRRTDADRATVAILAALFFGTGAAYYPVAWNAWLRADLMCYQSACYLALWATSKK